MATATATTNATNPLKRSIRLALIQLAGSTASKHKNIELAQAKVREAARNGAKLIILPECFNSPYNVKHLGQYAESIPARFLRQLPRANVPRSLLSLVSDVAPHDKKQQDVDSERTSEDNNAPTVLALSLLAEETKTYLIGGSIPEREPATGALFNTSLTFNPKGELLALHRKVHLFDIDIPGGITFKESDALAAGDQITTFAIPDVGTVGVGICYDVRFPELSMVAARGGPSRRASGADKSGGQVEEGDVQTGAFALVFPAAFNTTTGPMHWELLARARAVDNQVYVAMCSPARNREAEYVAYGHSLLVGPTAKVEQEAGEAEEVLYADLEPDAIQKARQSIPVTMQRRFDVYLDVGAR